MTEKDDKAVLDLYRKTRQQQPPKELDQRIRQGAQRKLSAARKRWMWGLSTAAVLLLSFNTVLQLNDPAPTHLDDIREMETETQEYSAMPGSKPSIEKKRAPASIMNEPSPAVSAPSEKAANADEFTELRDKFFDKQSLNIKRALTWESLENQQRQRTSQRQSTSEEASALQVVIPQLPVQLEALLSFDKGLQGDKTDSGLITIYDENKLILTVTALEHAYKFKAWTGAEVFGVRVNWNMKPSDLSGCRTGQTYISCSVNNRVDGLFEKDRLDHITWQVKHD